MIRLAVADDAPIIARLGRQFHAEAAWSDIVDYSVADCEATIRNMIAEDIGIVLVAEQDSEIVGIAGGIVMPVYFNHAHRTGQELFWWVKPGSRDGIGMMLLDALEEQACKAGCHSWGMICLDRVNPAAMGRLYRRRGYRASEHSYIKVL